MSKWNEKVRAILIREIMRNCFLGRDKASRIIDYLREQRYFLDGNIYYPEVKQSSQKSKKGK